MAKVVIKGKEYGLRFDLDAMEQCEEAFGGMKAMFDTLGNGTNQVKTVKKMFVILANTYNEAHDIESKVTEDVLKHLPVDVINRISAAVKDAIAEGMHTETMNGGEADDDVHDGYLEEIEREEKKTGV